MFSRVAQATCSSLSQQSTRRLVFASAQQHTLAPSSSLSAPATTTPYSLMKRFYHPSPSSSSLSSPFAADTAPATLRSLLHARSLSTRPAGSPSTLSYSHPSTASPTSSTPIMSSFIRKQQTRVSIVSRKYTSSSSSSSSTSSATATSTSAAGSAARLLTEESAAAAATVTGKAPLSFHEEMTRVRFSYNWWKEWTIIMGVFAVTGSSTVMVVKPLLRDVFKLDGSMKEGPWSFRIAYLCTTLPLYSCVLLTVATLAGRRPYFKKVVLRMWGRFLPKKALQRFQ